MWRVEIVLPARAAAEVTEKGARGTSGFETAIDAGPARGSPTSPARRNAMITGVARACGVGLLRPGPARAGFESASSQMRLTTPASVARVFRTSMMTATVAARGIRLAAIRIGSNE